MVIGGAVARIGSRAASWRAASWRLGCRCGLTGVGSAHQELPLGYFMCYVTFRAPGVRILFLSSYTCGHAAMARRAMAQRGCRFARRPLRSPPAFIHTQTHSYIYVTYIYPIFVSLQCNFDPAPDPVGLWMCVSFFCAYHHRYDCV